MIDLKAFRKENNLLQKDIADYLGVSREFVSMAESGKATLPYNHLRKLLDNKNGWNTNSLTDEDHIKGSSDAYEDLLNRKPDTGRIASLLLEIEMLRAQMKELKAEKEKYWEMICKLTEK